MSELQTRASWLGNGWRLEKGSICGVLQTIKGIIRRHSLCLKALEIDTNIFSLACLTIFLFSAGVGVTGERTFAGLSACASVHCCGESGRRRAGLYIYIINPETV